MNILLLDDEAGALHLLKKHVSEALPDAVLYPFMDPYEALDWYQSNSCDIAFLDIQLGPMNGIDVGRRLKEQNPKVNLIFVTAYLEYALPAHSLRASGYLLKPVNLASIRLELENLRYPMPMPPRQERLTATCFGEFSVSCDGKPVTFEDPKTLELLALLVDRRGEPMTKNEICNVLMDGSAARKDKWELHKLASELRKTLRGLGQEEAFVQTFTTYAVDPKRIVCDYYDYLNFVPYAVRAYEGEYMRQYPWAQDWSLRTAVKPER